MDSNLIPNIYENHEFYKFDRILKTIPKSVKFYKKKGFPHFVESSDWKDSVLAELIPHLSKAQTPKDPKDDFFDCRKSVYQQCLSVVEFSRQIAEVSYLLERTVNSSLFQLVEQYPRNGNVNRISGFLLLILRLIESTPWDEFEKRIGSKVMKNLDRMLKDLKIFKHQTFEIRGTAEVLGNAAEKTVRHGPNTDYGFQVLYRRQNGQLFDENDQSGSSDIKIGLTHARDLLTNEGMIQIVNISPHIRMGLLIMLLQHVKHTLASCTDQMKSTREILIQTNAPKKYNRVLPIRLSVFELALLRKSNGLLTKSTSDLRNLTLTLNYQSKFLYELRLPFKLLKEDLKDTSYAPPIESHVIMFQIILEESSLKKYVQNDWNNEAAATYITEKFTEFKS